jgi:hypothetical protein
VPSGYTSGTVNKITITARKEILVTTFVWFRCSFRIFDIKIDTPIDANIIRDIPPNTSNLTNAELKYTPSNPKMRANTAMSLLIFIDWFILFWKINHTPIPANTIRTEKNKNDSSVLVDACSDTESVSISVVIKKGFAALRYRNAGKLITPEEMITRPAIMAPPKIAKLFRN